LEEGIWDKRVVLLTFCFDAQSFFDRGQFLADQTEVVWLINALDRKPMDPILAFYK
jgi:hypothetical protein